MTKTAIGWRFATTHDEPQMMQWKICMPPKPVGWWCLYQVQGYSTQFAVWNKPTDERIKNTEELLGWKWKEAEE